MNGLEQFAIEQAMYSALGADLKTGVPDNLRGDVDAYYHDQHTHTGADRFRVSVNGVEAGTYRFDRTGGKPTLVVTDLDELKSWEDPDFDEFCARWVTENIARLARDYFHETGTVPAGMDVRREPVGVKGVYVPNREVVRQIRERLSDGESIAGLLGE